MRHFNGDGNNAPDVETLISLSAAQGYQKPDFRFLEKRE